MPVTSGRELRPLACEPPAPSQPPRLSPDRPSLWAEEPSGSSQGASGRSGLPQQGERPPPLLPLLPASLLAQT